MTVTGKTIIVERIYDEVLEIYEIYVNNHLTGYITHNERGYYHTLHDVGRVFYRNIREAVIPMAGLQLFDEWELSFLGSNSWQVIVDEVMVGYVWAEIGEDGLYRHYYDANTITPSLTWYATQLAAVYYLLESLNYTISLPPGVSL